MTHYRVDHQRVLGLVEQQHWLAFSSEDEFLLQACAYAGYITVTVIPAMAGKTRLGLTERGVKYLGELRAEPRSEAIKSTPPDIVLQRRASDIDGKST